MRGAYPCVFRGAYRVLILSQSIRDDGGVGELETRAANRLPVEAVPRIRAHANWIAALTMLLGIGSTCRADGDKMPSVDELLNGAMDTRRAIRSCELEITSQVDLRDFKTPSVDKDYHSHWLLSGNRILNRTTIGRPKGQVPFESLECRNCQASNSHSQWNNNDVKDKFTPRSPSRVSILKALGP